MTRSWAGPRPTPMQRHLLDACLDPDEHRAAAAWLAWRSRCDFDEEDPASHELASLAVARLGTALAGEATSARSLGWHRRAWYLSELAAGAAERIASSCEQRGLHAIALGDLAASLHGITFAGRRLPIRSIEVLVPGVDRSTRSILLEVAGSDAVGEAIRARRLSCVILDASQDRFAAPLNSAPRGGSGLALPSLGSMLARLAARNWCWSPPDRLRWMVEAAAILDAPPATPRLAEELRDSLHASESGAAAAPALRALRSILPSGTSPDRLDRLDLAIDAAAGALGGPRARLRAWVRRHPPDSLLARAHRTLGRWRRWRGSAG